jgi:hypothetical protein
MHFTGYFSQQVANVVAMTDEDVLAENPASACCLGKLVQRACNRLWISSGVEDNGPVYRM